MIFINLKSTNYRSTRNSRYPHCYLANGPTKKAGVAIFFAEHCQFSLISQHANSEGRYLILVGKLDNVDVTIVSCDAPNTEQLPFCKKLCETLEGSSR